MLENCFLPWSIISLKNYSRSFRIKLSVISITYHAVIGCNILVIVKKIVKGFIDKLYEQITPRKLPLSNIINCLKFPLYNTLIKVQLAISSGFYYSNYLTTLIQ